MTDNRAAFERFVEIFYTQKRVREVRKRLSGC
jgi:hypothetical protein